MKGSPMIAHWDIFFRCQRYPILRSQVLVALMAGTVTPTERVPVAALLDVFVLATAARERVDADIVDNYAELERRVREEWDGERFHVMSSQHGNCASSIVYLNADRKAIFDRPEDSYIPAMLSKLFEVEEVPQYIGQEMTEEKQPKRKKAA
jgi:hypothetical protein